MLKSITRTNTKAIFGLKSLIKPLTLLSWTVVKHLSLGEVRRPFTRQGLGGASASLLPPRRQRRLVLQRRVVW